MSDERWLAADAAIVRERRAAANRARVTRMPAFWVATALIPIVSALLAVAVQQR